MAGEPILIVDDNPTNMKLMSVLLTNHGHPVRTAASAEDALDMLESFLPRLILMDLQMPKVDGFEMARRVKTDARTRNIVIIAVTAYAMKGDEKRAREAGCDGYVTKPIDTRALPGLIAAHLSSENRGLAPAEV